MTKKDYILFADLIKTAKKSLLYASTNTGETIRTINIISDMIGNIFNKDNNRFNWDKWTNYINK